MDVGYLTGRCRRFRTGALRALGLALALAWAGPAQAEGGAGSLDPSFGGDGIVDYRPGEPGYSVTDASGFTRHVGPVAGTANGKFLAVGSLTKTGKKSKWGVLQFREDGTLDPTFGSSGQVSLFGSGPGDDTPSDVAIDTAGHVYVVGAVSRTVKVSKKKTVTEWNPAVVRLTPEGGVDTAWGSGGVVKLLGVGYGGPYGGPATIRLTLPSDGKVLLAGGGFVARLTPLGVLDASYGGGGGIAALSGAVAETVDGLTVDGDGKLLLVLRAATADGTRNVLRLDGNGVLDADFVWGDVLDDLAHLGVDDFLPMDVDVLSDGMIVVAGSCGGSDGYRDATLVALSAAGTIESDFGAGGVVVSARSGNDNSHALAIGADDSIFWAVAQTGAPAYVSNVRILATGALDEAYGSSGYSDEVAATSARSEIYVDVAGRVVQHCGTKVFRVLAAAN